MWALQFISLPSPFDCLQGNVTDVAEPSGSARARVRPFSEDFDWSGYGVESSFQFRDGRMT